MIVMIVISVYAIISMVIAVVTGLVDAVSVHCGNYTILRGYIIELSSRGKIPLWLLLIILLFIPCLLCYSVIRLTIGIVLRVFTAPTVDFSKLTLFKKRE